MRVLIVKLSSLGDVVHALPVIHDMRAAIPGISIDWVVEPGFAPLLQRVDGIEGIVELPLRRWRKAWWTAVVRAEFAAFRRRLRETSYDAVIDLQGLTKSVLVARLARGPSFGLAHRTDGSSYEAPARWLVDHPLMVPRHIHALDRSRQLAGSALAYAPDGQVQFGLHALQPHAEADRRPLMVFVHGTSRDDKLWPEADWITLGGRLVAAGWRIALPHAGASELARATRIAQAIGADCTVWPALGLDKLVDRMATASGVIGVDSGLSHIAVALGLPHVQLYNFPTSWRTGPQASHGHRHQVAIEAGPGQQSPTLAAVWQAWQLVSAAATG
ncbi:lipopolysaccharide heptosyltransferase I [Piscinibacter sakaiensis]|uniref:lipopolysaccharide heptosyltransferase I n=1 Tax=Piscinibacter sakaiensis TaxID=1547922 RepID=UPI003AAD6F3A